jgi:hypothetical protein
MRGEHFRGRLQCMVSDDVEVWACPCAEFSHAAASPMNLDLDGLEEKARKAKEFLAGMPEPWHDAGDFEADGFFPEVAPYLGACDPETVLALISRVREAERK